MLKDAQLRGKLLHFLFPIKDHRGRANDERRFADAALLVTEQHRQRLHGFAQSHVVRQTAAETVLLKKVEPIVAGFLIVAHDGDQALGQRGLL